jgi:hypothetical protein
MNLSNLLINSIYEGKVEGTILKKDDGWHLIFDSHDRDKVFSEEEIKNILNKYGSKENEYDFPNDGEKYYFDGSVMSVMPSNLESIEESIVGVYSAIEKRIAAIDDMLELRSRMSSEAKSKQEWKDRVNELKSEKSDLMGMLSRYKKWYDTV